MARVEWAAIKMAPGVGFRGHTRGAYIPVGVTGTIPLREVSGRHPNLGRLIPLAKRQAKSSPSLMCLVPIGTGANVNLKPDV